ncbi:hypothetical protein SUGI_0496680 [Cryptomeria japonica]|nr:hypothetical protein SUGI_0496680 [Cryptomeria japonica]
MTIQKQSFHKFSVSKSSCHKTKSVRSKIFCSWQSSEHLMGKSVIETLPPQIIRVERRLSDKRLDTIFEDSALLLTKEIKQISNEQDQINKVSCRYAPLVPPGR